MDKIKRNELAAEECVKRYQRICPEIVLNDYKGYPKEIKDLNAELKSILELTAVGSSEVHTSNIPNPTQDTAVDKVELAMNIAVVERMQELVEKTLSRLSEEHQELIDIFFFRKGLLGYHVQNYADTHYMGVAKVYRERRQALNEFARIYDELLGIE